MNRDSFVFYKSFYEAMQNIPEEDKLKLYEAICKYCFYDEIVELDGISKAMFILMKPNIDKANNRWLASVENGKKGGRPPKNNNQKKPNQNLEKPNHNLNKTKNKPNQNLNVDVDVDVDVDDDENGDENEETKTIDRFEEFWENYPKQRRRYNAEKAYADAVLNGVEEEWLIEAAKEYSLCTSGYDERFIKSPENWLKENLYLDYPAGTYEKEKQKHNDNYNKNRGDDNGAEDVGTNGSKYAPGYDPNEYF